ncbi:MAG: hypothetical protein CMJ78_01580 [Planctomycetaceae bacterium]|nr:hypothetical protein [Planctomycetaceae bacterium]
MKDRRVWKFWRLENMWGNLDLNPDPIVRDNIMYSAYLGTMMGAYMSATGDKTFNADECFQLQWKAGKTFDYDAPKIYEVVNQNFERAACGIFPCEPHWVFTLCNAMGMNALLLSDQVNGTDYGTRRLKGFRQSIELEMTSVDGRWIPVTSVLLGFAIPAPSTLFLDAPAAFFMNSIALDLARRSWRIIRQEAFDFSGGKPTLKMSNRPFDRLDTGNYMPSDIGAYASMILAARETGDVEIYDAMQQALDKKFSPKLEQGELSYKCSNSQNLFLSIGRFGRQNGFQDLLRTGLSDEQRNGPILSEAPYPNVMVAKATTDGKALSLVLRPGDEAGRFPLKLSRLQPGQKYNVSAAVMSELTAERDGGGLIEVELSDRLEVEITPAS